MTRRQGSWRDYRYHQKMFIPVGKPRVQENQQWMITVCANFWQWHEGVLWSELCFPLKIICWNFVPQRWWYGEVGPVDGWLSYEGRIFMNGSSALWRRLLLPVRTQREGTVTINQEEYNCSWCLDLVFPSLENYENYTFVVYKPPFLLYFV